MSWDVIRVTEDLKRPAGHAIVTLSITDVNELPESLEFAIHRRGHNDNALGEEGWQGADYWFTPDEAWLTDQNSVLQFVFRSEAIYELQNMPYELLLRGRGMEEPVAVPLYWPDILESEEATKRERRPIGEGAHIREPSPHTQPPVVPPPESREQEAVVSKLDEDEKTSPAVRETIEQEIVEPTTSEPQTQNSELEEKRGAQGGSDILKLLLLIGIILGCVLLVVAGYFMLTGNDAPSPEQQEQQEVLRESAEPEEAAVNDQTTEAGPITAVAPEAPDSSSMPPPEVEEEPEPEVQQPVSDPPADPADPQQTPVPVTGPEQERSAAEANSLQEIVPPRAPQQPADEDLGKELQGALDKELHRESTIQSEFEALINEE